MVTVLLWVAFGSLVGWAASMVGRARARHSLAINILVGVLGAIVGGLIMHEVGGSGLTTFNVTSLVVATLGATLLLFLYKIISRDY